MNFAGYDTPSGLNAPYRRIYNYLTRFGTVSERRTVNASPSGSQSVLRKVS